MQSDISLHAMLNASCSGILCSMPLLFGQWEPMYSATSAICTFTATPVRSLFGRETWIMADLYPSDLTHAQLISP